MSSVGSDSDGFEAIDHPEARLPAEDVDAIAKWLQPTDYAAESSEFKRHLSSQAPGTGRWVWRTSNYKEWLNSEVLGSIWIKGVPGAGKSVVAASLVDHFQSEEEVPVLFFFFRNIIEGNRRPISLVRDYLEQLLPHSSRLQHTLHSLIKTSLGDISFGQLWDYLLDGLSSVEKTYCVIDALDEMQIESSDTFLRSLNDLATFRPKNVKLLLTSRPKQYLQSVLTESFFIHINLQQDLVGQDIATYVAHRLNHTLENEDQRAETASLICSRSRGLFLYARLILDQVSERPRSEQAEITSLASSLPAGLEEMYDSVLLQKASVIGISTSVQVSLLALVTHSSRALRLNELAGFLDFSFPDRFSARSKDIARLACGPLLEVLEDETVQVIHHSFTEFLLGSSEQSHIYSNSYKRKFPTLNSIETHKNLTITCLDYLQNGCLSAERYGIKTKLNCVYCEQRDCKQFGHRRPEFDYAKAQLQHPFLRYAIGNWSHHGQYYQAHDEEFFQVIEDFSKSENFDLWIGEDIHRKFDPVEDKTGSPCLLHVAAYMGLVEYATHLLKSGIDVNSLDRDGRSPIWWAANRGHVRMVSFLLEEGAKPDEPDEKGFKPLHQAVINTNALCVRALLEAGGDLMSSQACEDGKLFRGDYITRGYTAVYYAAATGHLGTIAEILPYLNPEALAELLCDCCQFFKPDAVEMILDKSDVSPNSTYNESTAISLAIRRLDVRSVKALLARGANPNLASRIIAHRLISGPNRGESSITPLEDLVGAWTPQNHCSAKQILDLLIQEGSISLESALYGKILFGLVSIHKKPHIPAISALIEVGANFSSANKDGTSFLSYVLKQYMDVELVELLVEKRVPLEFPMEDGKNVWHFLFERSKMDDYHTRLTRDQRLVQSDCIEAIARILCRHGASALIQLRDNNDYSGLDNAVASSGCNSETLELLLGYCDRQTLEKALWIIVRSKDDNQKAKYRKLVTAGASVDARDDNGATVLLHHAHDPEVFCTLLSCGAKLDAVDNKGKGVLQYYLAGPNVNVKRLQQLIDLGLDPKTIDREGNSILHVAASHFGRIPKSIGCLRWIINLGVSATSLNHSRRTALHSYLGASQGKHLLRPLLALMRETPDFDINSQDINGYTAIHQGAMRSVSILEVLLEAGANPLIYTKDKENVLHLACRARQIDVVGRLVLETGTQLINARNTFGQTPLHLACRAGMVEAVDFLLTAGAIVTIEDNRGRTPLQACTEFSVEQKLWFRLDHQTALQDPKLNFLDTDRAVANRDERWFGKPSGLSIDDRMPQIGTIAKMLIKFGAGEDDQERALCLAVEFGVEAREVIDVLLESVKTHKEYRNSSMRSRTIPTATFMSRRTKLLVGDPFFQDLMDNPDEHFHLLDLDDIKVLLDAGYDPTGITTGFEKGLLLHMAVNCGLVAPVQLMAEAARRLDNIDPKEVAPSYSGWARKIGHNGAMPAYVEPLLHACASSRLTNIHMMRILIEDVGVDVNSRTPLHPNQHDLLTITKGGTALHVLARKLEAIKYLVLKGANVNARDHNGLTPLHISCGGETVSAVDSYGTTENLRSVACSELLLDLGAEVNALDNDGLTPLFYTASEPTQVRLLLKRGADVNAGNISPLISAVNDWGIPLNNRMSLFPQSYEGFSLMVDAGADINAHMPPGSSNHTQSCRTLLYEATFSVPTLPKHIDLLIQKGANLFAPIREDETLLHFVFENGRSSILETYLKHARTIDWNTRDQQGRTVFLAACGWKNVHRVSRRSDDDESPILSPEPFLRLLNVGADPLAQDHKSRNALHHLLISELAIEKTIIEFLSIEEYHPLVFQHDSHGKTPLQYALEYLRPVVCERLIELSGNKLPQAHSDNFSILHYIAAQYLRHEYFSQQYHPPQYYIDCRRLWTKARELGVAVNALDREGHPPLYHFINSHHRGARSPVECMSDLFEDRDLTARGAGQETALHWVAGCQKDCWRPEVEKALFQHLLAKGLDPLAEDKDGRTSLDIAAAHKKTHILELLQYDS